MTGWKTPPPTHTMVGAGEGATQPHRVQLASLCWRILNHPSSLVAKIMREKYFKYRKLLDAKLGCGSSFIQKYWWSSLDLVNEDLIWRVGDGSNIEI